MSTRAGGKEKTQNRIKPFTLPFFLHHLAQEKLLSLHDARSDTGHEEMGSLPGERLPGRLTNENQPHPVVRSPLVFTGLLGSCPGATGIQSASWIDGGSIS
jgi:hypothetical protein